MHQRWVWFDLSPRSLFSSSVSGLGGRPGSFIYGEGSGKSSLMFFHLEAGFGFFFFFFFGSFV